MKPAPRPVSHRLIAALLTLAGLVALSPAAPAATNLRGMETGILNGLEQAAKLKGIDWNTLYEQLKAEKRWHIEVY